MGLPYWPWRYRRAPALDSNPTPGLARELAGIRRAPRPIRRPVAVPSNWSPAIVPNGMATPFVTFANAGTAYAPSGDTSVWGFAVDGSTDQASFVIDSTVGTFVHGVTFGGVQRHGPDRTAGRRGQRQLLLDEPGRLGRVRRHISPGWRVVHPCGDYSSAFGDFGTGYLIQSGGTLLADRAIDFAKANDAAGYYMLSGSGILNAGELTFGQKGMDISASPAARPPFHCCPRLAFRHLCHG